MKDKYWIKSGTYTLLQKLTVVFFGFGSFYILVRILTKDEFGAWSLFMAVTTFLEVTRNGLIQNALIKFLSFNDKEEHSKIISASFAISGGLTIICIIINLGFADLLSKLWDSPQLTSMFYLYTVVFVISGILTQFQFVEQANFKFSGIFFSSFIRQGALFGYILICYLFHFSLALMELVYVQIAAVTVSTFIAYHFAKPFLTSSYTFRWVWIKKLFNFGKYVFGTSVSSVIFNTIDQMMLGAMVSTAAAGAYNIAIRITNLVEIPTSSVSAIVFPQSAKRMDTEGKPAIKYLYEKSVGVILAILLPGLLFALLFSDLIVELVAGEKYAETVPILRITIIYCFFIPYGRQFGTILDSIGKPKLTFRIVLLSALINIAANFILIRQYGIIGAAYGTLFSNVIGFLIGQFILKRELDVRFFNTLIYARSFYYEFFVKYLRPHLSSK